MTMSKKEALREIAAANAEGRPARLQGAELIEANLIDADLIFASLIGADLRGAYLNGADLRGAYLNDADLRGAKLIGAKLFGANLFGATGIRIAGPVGGDGRMIYGVRHEGGAMIQAGCFWGTVPEVIAAIEARYADGSGLEHHRAAYLAAVAWVGGV